MENNKVFISSTVYDLIDIRREVEHLLREMNLDPILSGSNSSSFKIDDKVQSVECCLVNLRTCDTVIVILCQRYGSPIPGFEDGTLSATHLEYREAVSNNKRILFYVRDTLEAERASRRKNKGPDYKPFWAHPDDFVPLLRFFEEHKKLSKDREHSNWVSTFTDSVDLKRLVRQHLALAASKADLERCIIRNELPWIQMRMSHETQNVTQGQPVRLRYTFVNHGSVPAFRIAVNADGQEPLALPALAPGQDTFQIVFITLDSFEMKWPVEVTYSAASGHRIADQYTAGLTFTAPGGVVSGASFRGKNFFPFHGGELPFTISDPEFPETTAS